MTVRVPTGCRHGLVGASDHRGGHTGSMSSEESAGRLSVVIWYRTLWWAVDALAEKLPPEELGRLNVRSGEHLAAILTTAFLHTAPAEVDTTGGVDLRFDLSDARHRKATILPAHALSAAFEVKSLPGEFREFDAGIDRDRARGVDTIGRGLDQGVRAANDVLHEAGPWIRRGWDQLRRKTSRGTSMNVFLVIHPLDYVTAECLTEPVIGMYLDPLEDVGDLDTVWVLWAPDHLTVWSYARHEWINLLFDNMNPDETDERTRKPTPLATLQEAEQYFLTRTGHTGGSPYLFLASYE
jgi:hypothetical protein